MKTEPRRCTISGEPCECRHECLYAVGRDASENLKREAEADDDQSQGLEFSLAARVWLALIGAVMASAGLVWLVDKALEGVS